MAILSEAIGIIQDVSGIFKQNDPTPAEQKQKAGVWYRMLQDFVTNDPTPEALAARWRDQLPFKQKATKQRFMDNNILNHSRDSIINTLVDKINDELLKGGFNIQSRDAILSGMGAGSILNSGPSGMSTVDAAASDPILPEDVTDKDGNESNNYFFIIGLLVLVAGSLAWLFSNPKKRRR